MAMWVTLPMVYSEPKTPTASAQQDQATPSHPNQGLPDPDSQAQAGGYISPLKNSSTIYGNAVVLSFNAKPFTPM